MPDRRTRTLVPAPPAARGAGGGSTAFEVSRFTEALVFIDVTAVSGTDPTLDVEVEAGPEADEMGFLHAAAPQIAAPGRYLVKLTNLGAWLRLAWTVGGTNPSFTFGAKLVLKT